ncbi:MAG: asparagine synthase C-terminal domain-containing protein [Anaerolineae bacterium]|nr:asparagine synthase C-terminal domain-containing protein [Anaerolineae bacterium]
MSAQVSAPVRTYAVAFEARSGGANELPYARMAAAQFGAVHEEISVTEQDVAGGFDALVAALDQPSIDGPNTYFASQAARRGVTVALSGLGGDELFAGYPHFGHFMRASRWLPHGRRALQWAVAAGGDLLPGRWRVPLAYMASAPAARHAMARQLFAAREKRAILNPAWLDGAQPAPTERWYAALVRPHLDPIAQVSYAEAAGYMAHTLLRDTDAMSMAHALEVRVPFLDHVLAEFVFALPAAWKWQAGAGKAVLRRAVRDLLPGAILHREKAGFQFPIATWMQGVLQQPAREAFHDRTAARLFQRRAVEGLLASRRKAVQAWGVLVLLAWIKQSGVTL